MPEPVGDRAVVDAGGDQVRRMRMPQIMESHVRQIEPLKARQVIPVADVAGVERPGAKRAIRGRVCLGGGSDRGMCPEISPLHPPLGGGEAGGLTMRLTFVQPRPELRAYIESFWIFESDSGLPAADTSIAVPNGCAKLIIPYKNSLWSRHPGGQPEETKEHGLYFVGVQEAPTFLTSSSHATGFIAIEFSPHGAHRFLRLPMSDTTNGRFSFSELQNRAGREMQEILSNLSGVNQKMRFVQTRLAGLLRNDLPLSGVVDYVVSTLRAAGGLTPIKALEQETGYSSRYLELLFRERVGVSPKTLARIFRFQRVYERWARGQRYDMLTGEIYDYYYDQPHFAKEFKKFTGYPPRRFAREVFNEFGRRLTLR